MAPADIARRYGRVTDFMPWRGYREGPIGTITDDTELTMCVAQSILDRGSVDPIDLAERFVEWAPTGRGKGRTTVMAIANLAAGRPWNEAGIDSAGNGAAMRVAPIALLHPNSVDRLRVDAALTSVITHAHDMAVASAIAQAFSVAYCLHRRPGDFDMADYAAALEAVLADVADEGQRERRPGAAAGRVRLTDRLQEVLGMLDAPPERVFAYTYNGAFVLESLPAAVWCFAAYHDDPERAIVTAVNGGYDADTVASMTGNLVGALHGASALPERWLADLEYREDLADMALGVLELAKPVGS